MMPQFENADWRARGDNIAVGVALLAIGLFKKTVLADGIAAHVAPVFANAAGGQPVSFLFAWVGAIGFTLQMYFDFSGYSEMALGLARMLGIRLPMNFNSPLKAVSLIDYWSRWHITLTRFLTAYVYNPIALRRARARLAAGQSGMAGPRTTWGAFAGIVALPTGLTMFLSGLWHGAGNQFLVFGLIHGAGLIVNHAWRLARPRLWRDTAAYQRRAWPLAWLITFITAMIALTFFHADSVASGGDIVAGLFGLHGVVLPDPVANLLPGLAAALSHIGITFGGGGLGELVTATSWIVPLLLIALVPPNTLEIMRDYGPAVTMPGESTAGRIDLCPKSLRGSLRWSMSPRWAAVTAALTSAGILGLGRVSEFLYWQF
jgi:D-alanyl-lipoteichoic acid acyltransferase DltB (MBOAT superfamily)